MYFTLKLLYFMLHFWYNNMAYEEERKVFYEL